jgi:hypothetical protein
MLARPGTQIDAERASLRRELGLPADRPVVLSGHQASWWHAGILAKFFALDALARRVDAHAGWVVVDQDSNAFSQVAYPADKGDGQITQGVWFSAPAKLAADQRADCALASLPTFTPQPLPTDAATVDAGRGLRAIDDCLRLHTGAASAGGQVGQASIALATSLLPAPAVGPTVLFASKLCATAAMQSWIGRMLADPGACVGAYNQAVRKHAVFGVAPLGMDESRKRYELPLWRLPPGLAGGSGGGSAPMPRQRVYAHTLAGIPPEQLAPRALLMTAFLRAFACDLFIHGTGGGATTLGTAGDEAGYDRVAEDWVQGWLGITLVPSVVASATLLLDLGTPPTASLEDVRQARRLIHSARHTPALLGNASAQAQKEALVGQIRVSNDAGERARLYRQMHGLLDGVVAGSAGEMGAIKARAEALSGAYAREGLLRDRTWPWPLHSRGALLGLAKAVREGMGV